MAHRYGYPALDAPRGEYSFLFFPGALLSPKTFPQKLFSVLWIASSGVSAVFGLGSFVRGATREIRLRVRSATLTESAKVRRIHNQY